jgi:hypothetical protein
MSEFKDSGTTLGNSKIVFGNKEKLRGIRQSYEEIMMAVEFELRRLLRAMGANITRETTQEQMEIQMELMGVEIFHVNYKKSPKFSGWHIYQHKQPIMILCDPKLDPKDRNRIIIERKLPNDVN